MVILVLKEITVKLWRGINSEKTAREYKRRSEISPGELQLQLRHGFRSDGSDLGTDQASYGLAKAQHVEQKLCTDSRSESGSASSA